jgi:hypothetical protein
VGWNRRQQWRIDGRGGVEAATGWNRWRVGSTGGAGGGGPSWPGGKVEEESRRRTGLGEWVGEDTGARGWRRWLGSAGAVLGKERTLSGRRISGGVRGGGARATGGRRRSGGAVPTPPP